MNAENYGMEIEVLPAGGYRQPRAHMQSYVALCHPETGRAYGRRVAITVPIRKGRQDLEIVARHISEKVETLLEASSSTMHDSSEVPSVRVTHAVLVTFDRRVLRSIPLVFLGWTFTFCDTRIVSQCLCCAQINTLSLIHI